MVTFNRASDAKLNLKVTPQRRSLKGLLLLFVEPYTAGARDSENYFNPDLTKVSITINGVPNMVFSNGIEGKDMWEEAMHDSGTRLVNSTDGIQLELERDTGGSGNVNCHIFVISDSQFNLVGRQLASVQY